MKTLPAILLGGAVLISALAPATAEVSPSTVKTYYTRLPFDDQGFTGKYADIVIDLPQQGQFIFSREFGYQPYWLPVGGKQQSVVRLIPRKGDGPDERPDNHNIACNATIVAQADASVTVHWRYAPDITKLSFTDFRAAYNETGNPAPFYADYGLRPGGGRCAPASLRLLLQQFPCAANFGRRPPANGPSICISRCATSNP